MIRNPDAYLTKTVTNYRDECAPGFPNAFEAKHALWKVEVAVYEIAPDPEPWIVQLRIIARRYLRGGQVESTLRSAARQARRG